MYYRFELYVDGGRQDVGVIQGLDDTAIDEDEKQALVSAFDGKLPVPPVFSKGRTESWFTELGLAEFGDAMEEIAAAYEEDGLFEVRRVEAEELDQDSIAYADEWQVVVWL